MRAHAERRRHTDGKQRETQKTSTDVDIGTRRESTQRERQAQRDREHRP